MLTFRNVNIVFGVLLLVLLTIDFIFSIPSIYYLFFPIAYLFFLFYGSYFINSSFYMPVICEGERNLKKIALSFDDGPVSNTLEILKILDAYNVKATFFCIGKHIEKNVDILRQVNDAGHLIGNHSYIHAPAFDFWRTKKVTDDLQKTQSLIYESTGRKVSWFRPPFGVTNANIAMAIKKLNYTSIGWSIRSLDTVTNSKAILLDRVKKKLHPGAIILFHDTHVITAQILPAFIKYAQAQGYKIVPMNKLLNLPAYAN